MKPMQIKITTSDKTVSDTLVFPILKDKRLEDILFDIAEITSVSTDALIHDFEANSKEVHSFYSKRGAKVFLVGLGEKPDGNKVIQTCRSFIHHNKEKLPNHLVTNLSFGKIAAHAESILTGFLLGTYNINLYQTGEKKEIPLDAQNAQLDVYVEKSQLKKVEVAIDRAQKTAATLRKVFDLINQPANKKRPQDMADYAVKAGKESGFSVRVMQKPEIEKEGLHGLLAVNRGSEDPAVFIVMEYKPKTKKKVKKIALVGKGVTFDTGGLSIKASTNMHLMKSDMGGSGAVFGAIEMVAKLELPIHLIAIVGATDNSVDALSYKPSDVISSYAGKTIEVIDTDAEGRLTLADGLAYVNKNYNPDVMIDIATLTGSVIRALGYAAGGLFTKSDNLAKDLLTAGKETGEKLWQMPMWDEYKPMIKSDVADVRNYSGKPIAGSITAAKFLEHFVSEHPNWAHVDIAGTSVTANEFGSDRNATGFGVRLLLQFIENYAKQ